MLHMQLCWRAAWAVGEISLPLPHIPPHHQPLTATTTNVIIAFGFSRFMNIFTRTIALIA